MIKVLLEDHKIILKFSAVAPSQKNFLSSFQFFKSPKNEENIILVFLKILPHIALTSALLKLLHSLSSDFECQILTA